MKKIYYLCLTCLITCLMTNSTSVYAGIPIPPTDIMPQTKSPAVEKSALLPSESLSKSTLSIKLAAIHSMTDEGGLSFKAPKSVSCASGYKNYNGKCVLNCDRTVYPFTTTPSSEKGTYASCVGETTYYGYTSCKTGWTLKDHDCIDSNCDGYPYSSNPGSTMGTAVTCKSGTATFYKYSSCNNGWTLKSGMCEPSKCMQADYPYPVHPGDNAGVVKSCKTGEITYYGYESCNSGWTKSGSYCNKVVCSATTYPYASNPATNVGTVVSCKSGDDTFYGYSACNSGWTATGGYCNVNPCEGYTATSSTIAGCLTPASCKKGASTFYKCATCKDGYKVSSTGTCVANSCADYKSTSASITGCMATVSCKKGDSLGYRCAECSPGYTLATDGTCTAKACSGYGSSTATIAGCSSSESCVKGTATVYKCLICETGFTMNSSGGCDANGCSGYSSTSPNMTGCMETELCMNGATKKYKCVKCQEGYTLQSNGTCSANTCASPYQTSATIANCVNNDICISGTTKYYKCNTCKDGFTVSNGACTANTCTGFGSTTANIANCMDTEFCQAGNDKKYKCVKCQDGYTMNSSGSCVAITCATKYHSKNSAAITGCLETDYCLSGTDKMYTCEKCQDGYTLTSSGTCTANTCASPYSSARCTVDNCVEYDVCMAGATKTCKCKTCKDGFAVNSSGTCTANTCSGYGSDTANIANCMETDFCLAGNVKKYKCIKCQVGYISNYVMNSNNVCISNTCADKYHSSTAAITGCLETEECLSGSAKKYTCVKCKDGYTLNSTTGKCDANTCASPFTTTAAVTGCVEYDTCMAGDTKNYKCRLCKEGYTLKTSGTPATDIGKCIPDSCNGYYSDTIDITGCMETDLCMSGDSKKYKCVKPDLGYTTKSDGTCCQEKTCDGYDKTTADITGCMETDFCQSGANKKYKCVKCQEGYTLSGGACAINQCEGYGSTTADITGCLQTDLCMYGSVKKYRCRTCRNGYTMSSGTCVANECAGYTADSPAIDGCLETDVCLKGDVKKHKCMMCKDGYTYNSSNSTCTANSCEGYTLSFPSSGTCIETDFCMKGDVKKYKCTVCYPGYYMESGSCKDCAYWDNLYRDAIKAKAGISVSRPLAEMDLNHDNKVTLGDIQIIINMTNDSGCERCLDYESETKDIDGCQETDFCMVGSKKKYKCTVCQEGYTLYTTSNSTHGECTPNTCSSDYHAKSDMIGCHMWDTCKTGTTEKYKCTRCEIGYHLDGSTNQTTCRKNHCPEYNIGQSASSESNHCIKFDTCEKGNVTMRKCEACATGYELRQKGSSQTYDPEETGLGTWTYQLYECVIDPICNQEVPDWHKDIRTLANCLYVDDHPCDGFFMHQCRACKGGYLLDELKRCVGTDCSSWSLNSCPSNATCESCTSGSTTKYRITSCATGYEISTTGISCQAIGPDCNVGDFVYRNKTCGPDYVAKTGNSSAYAIGIVVDKINRSAMTLCAFTGSENTNTWSHGDYVHPLDVPDLPNRTTEETAVDDYDGSGNTTIVHAYADSLGNPYIHQAFAMCYYNSTLSYSQYLPSAGELNGVHGSMDKIAAAYTKMGVSFNSAMNKVLWTSTEKSGDEAWTVNPVGGGVVTKNKGLLGVQHFIGTCCFFKY